MIPLVGKDTGQKVFRHVFAVTPIKRVLPICDDSSLLRTGKVSFQVPHAGPRKNPTKLLLPAPLAPINTFKDRSLKFYSFRMDLKPSIVTFSMVSLIEQSDPSVAQRISRQAL